MPDLVRLKNAVLGVRVCAMQLPGCEGDISDRPAQARFCKACARKRHLSQMLRSKRVGPYNTVKSTMDASLGSRNARADRQIEAGSDEKVVRGSKLKYRVLLERTSEHCRRIVPDNLFGIDLEGPTLYEDDNFVAVLEKDISRRAGDRWFAKIAYEVFGSAGRYYAQLTSPRSMHTVGIIVQVRGG